MARSDPPDPQPTELQLAAGAQAVINAALVTARGPCLLQVGSGAHVLHGRSLWRTDSAKLIARELYYRLLQAQSAGEDLRKTHGSYFALLGQIVAQMRTHEAQVECARCAAALTGGDYDTAIKSVRRLSVSLPTVGVEGTRRLAAQRAPPGLGTIT